MRHEPQRDRSGREALRRLLAALMAALLGGSLSHATRVRPLNLEQLTDKAARIVSGRVLSVEAGEDAALGTVVTVVTLELDRSLKGGQSRTLTLKMLGSREGIAPTGPVGLPHFEAGEELILFLYGESRAGLTSPVGLGQGKFVKFRDKQGRQLAINGTGNQTLFTGLSAEAAQSISGLRQTGRDPLDLAPDKLLGMVEKLEQRRKAKTKTGEERSP